MYKTCPRHKFYSLNPVPSKPLLELLRGEVNLASRTLHAGVTGSIHGPDGLRNTSPSVDLYNSLAFVDLFSKQPQHTELNCQ